MTKRSLVWLCVALVLYLLLVWVGVALVLTGPAMLATGLVLSVCGLTLAGVYILVSRLTPSRPAESAATAAVPSAESQKPGMAPGYDRDLEPLLPLIQDANRQLASSPTLSSRRVKTTVQDLPLYVLAGADGSGKTTTFLHSGLEPELLAGQVYREDGSQVMPTRVGNVWFTQGCAVAEAAGQFFSGEPGHWVRFVTTLLGKARISLLQNVWRGPQQGSFRGVVLFCDVTPFVGIPDTARHAAMARSIHERLQLLGQTLQADFPVWVVFTRADRIPNFADYFQRLTEVEERQVLGCTLPEAEAGGNSAKVYAESEGRRLTGAFNQLYHSLAFLRTRFLAREADAGKKPGVYEFPRELKRLRSVLVQFLIDAFRPAALQPGPRLQGFYFTGVRQVSANKSAGDGVRMDRTVIGGPAEATRLFNVADAQREMSRAAAEFAGGVQNEQTVPRWAFVSQLFSDVIFSTSAPAVAQYVDKRVALYRNIGAAAATILLLLGAGLFTMSWLNNRRVLLDVQQAAASVRPLSTSSQAEPGGLDSMDALLARLEQLTAWNAGTPFRLNFGLYSGSTVLAAVREVYFARFREYFLRDVERTIGATLGSLPAGQSPQYPHDIVYDQLKAYLVMTRSGCTPERPATPKLLAQLWRRNLPPERALPHFDFYIRELQQNRVPFTVAPQADLIAGGRTYLQQFGGEERIYRSIIDSINASLGAPVRVSDYTNKHGLVLEGPQEVQPAFTRKGWDAVQERIRNATDATDTCVVSRTAATPRVPDAALRARLREIYATDYVRKWTEFLAATKVMPYSDTGDAAEKLGVMASYDSPLIGLLYIVHEQTAVPALAAAPPVVEKAVEQAQKGILERISARFGAKGAAAAKQVQTLQGARGGGQIDVQRVFQPVHSLFAGEESRTKWIGKNNEPYAVALSNLQRSMNALRGSPEDPALNADAGRATQDGLAIVNRFSYAFERGAGVDEQVRRLLESPFENARGKYIADAGKANAKKLNGAAGQFCAAAAPVLKKYPFNANAAEDATAEEVARVFARPGGTLWAFHQQHLAPLLTEAGGQWMLSPGVPPNVKLDPSFLQDFNRLAQISRALYGDGNGSRYRLNALPNPSIKKLSLTVNGATMAQGPQEFSWPGAQPHELRMLVNIGGTVPIVYDGLWGIFSLLGDAEHAPGTKMFTVRNIRSGRRSKPAQLEDENGKPVAIQLEVQSFPAGVESAFDRGFFAVRCPGKVAVE